MQVDCPKPFGAGVVQHCVPRQLLTPISPDAAAAELPKRRPNQPGVRLAFPEDRSALKDSASGLSGLGWNHGQA